MLPAGNFAILPTFFHTSTINKAIHHHHHYTLPKWPKNTAQKMKFSIKDIFSKCESAGNCGFGHIY